MVEQAERPAPDFTRGYPVADLADDTPVSGRLGTEDALLVRRGDTFFAIGAKCTHYHGALADGLVVGDTIRCPLHHACFSLQTGEALRAPALDAVACWRVERVGDRVFLREKHKEPETARPPVMPPAIVIVGGGGAGLAAAQMVRRQGYHGPVTMLSADDAAPCDRPNLSKDFLAGTAGEDWIPLRESAFYTEQRIDLVLGARVTKLDVTERHVALDDGRRYAYGALLLATGAEPVRLTIPGTPAAPILYLRSFADSKAIIARASSATRALVIGASFIGLEVAASLRARGIEVHVAAPEQQPLERVMGPDVGRFIRALHERHGVTFHLGTTVSRLDGTTATLSDGSTVEADLVVAGVGVRPSTQLAEGAGLKVDRGVVVNEYLETSARGVFAAGDIARWPDPHTGDAIRVEHWVVAENQGQVAARNMLGRLTQYDDVPFFWSQHYDVTVNYVGHAEKWDATHIDGSLQPDGRDCRITYSRARRTLAVATIGRDRQSLEAAARMARE